MIIAPRREGVVRDEVDSRARIPAIWRNLDRNIPLGVKLIVPVIFVTLLATGGLGVLDAAQTNNNIQASYADSASAVAESSAKAFFDTIGDPPRVTQYLDDLVSAQPNVVGIWIVNVVVPGQPVVASSTNANIDRKAVLDQGDILVIEAGHAHSEVHTVKGVRVLETVAPVQGNAFGVIVVTSLAGEDETLRSSLAWALFAALITSMLEVVALMVLLEGGVLRRVRRVAGVVESFGSKSAPKQLSEGSEAPGRDALFNLARAVDHKLRELREHERAGSVVSELGLLALQGVRPEDLIRKALEITRHAGDLERCFLVDAKGMVTVVDSAGSRDDSTSQEKLPVWIGALVRSATQARRPVLADGFGEQSRYWEAGASGSQPVAAFVPLAGTPSPIGVMVGVARAGNRMSPATISMMEAVAAALGESLQRSDADKARHESEAKSKALSTVSHEMRNPLNAMLGFSNLLLTGAAGPLNEKQERYVRRVDDASRHLLRLVNDYLDLAKVMSGSLPVVPEAVAVGPEVQGVLELLGPTADAKNVSVRSEVVPGVIARADRMRLRQVLMNLVSNAIKFTPARGHVRVEVAGGSNGVRISVIDTGVGIPADRQHLVFTEFAQLRADAQGEGTGLGLALTKRFVEAMGGFIRFTSAEGAGTIFDVWLPGEQTPVKATAEPLQATAVSAGAA